MAADEEFELGMPIELEGEEFKAVAFCVGHVDGDERHWRVLLQLADGRVVASERKYVSEREAYEQGVEWLREQGGEIAQ